MARVKSWRRVTRRAETPGRFESDGRQSYFRVTLSEQDGRILAELTGHQGPGNLFSLVRANALLVVPAGVWIIDAGQQVEVWAY